MLRSLSIRDFAVIAALDIEFSPGFNVLTGQTGAGKSILVEALGFLLGARGSLDWLRSGAPRLEVSGLFDREDFPADLRERFKIAGPRAAVKRELDSSGKTKAYFNGQPAPLSVLAGWGEGLADFHSQHEHQTLLKNEVQLDLLDGFAGVSKLRGEVGEAYERWSRLGSEIKALQLSEEERLKRIDLDKYQLSEIDAVDPKPSEEEDLEALLPRLKNAERLGSLSEEVYQVLYEREGSVQENLLKAGRLMEELARIDPALAPELEALKQAEVLARDAAGRLAGYRGGSAADPGRLDEVLSRLDKIGKLRKKYGPAVSDVLAHRDHVKTELSWLERSAERAGEVEEALAKAEGALAKLCSDLHKLRVAAAAKLASKIARELKELGMGSARFSASVEMEEGRFGPTGADQAEFLIAPNPGEPLKPLKSIASGGELSRVMLALKTVLAQTGRPGVFVFDEVDTGVGAEIGRAVGRRLADLAHSHQVLCVTHLPQVACFAGRHFHVSKEVSGGRTFVRVGALEGDGRLDVLARMLGGRQLTPASRKHALELLEDCR